MTQVDRATELAVKRQPDRCLAQRPDLQLPFGVVEVKRDRPAADAKDAADFPSRLTFYHPSQTFTLARCQELRAISSSSVDLLGLQMNMRTHELERLPVKRDRTAKALWVVAGDGKRGELAVRAAERNDEAAPNAVGGRFRKELALTRRSVGRRRVPDHRHFARPGVVNDRINKVVPLGSVTLDPSGRISRHENIAAVRCLGERKVCEKLEAAFSEHGARHRA